MCTYVNTAVTFPYYILVRYMLNLYNSKISIFYICRVDVSVHNNGNNICIYFCFEIFCFFIYLPVFFVCVCCVGVHMSQFFTAWERRSEYTQFPHPFMWVPELKLQASGCKQATFPSKPSCQLPAISS